MSYALRTPEDYELFVYTLTDQFSSVHESKLVFVRRGATFGKVAGELFFDHDFRLVVRERLIFDRLPGVIDFYGYEIWRGDEKLCWYDSQPHPDDLGLQHNHPHHKHIHPDIKHNRIPAPQMSFHHPNLPLLIREIEELINQIAG